MPQTAELRTATEEGNGKSTQWISGNAGKLVLRESSQMLLDPQHPFPPVEAKRVRG